MDCKPVDFKPADSDPPTTKPSDTPATSTQPTPPNLPASITHLPNASIFAAPPHTLLLHACNARGSWGAGVAAAFKSQYPHAFKVYNKHCLTLPNDASTNPPPSSRLVKEWQKSLVGTCFIIPPHGDQEGGEKEAKGHWLGCLFTSWGYGKQVDGVEEIVANTRKAVADLRGQLEDLREMKEKGGEEDGDGEGKGGIERVWSVKINSGMFGVEWERTEEVLKEGGVDMVIVTPKEGEGTGRKRKMRSGQGEGGKKAKKDDGGDGADERDKVNGDGPTIGLRKSARGSKQGGLDGWLK